MKVAALVIVSGLILYCLYLFFKYANSEMKKHNNQLESDEWTEPDCNLDYENSERPFIDETIKSETI